MRRGKRRAEKSAGIAGQLWNGLILLMLMFAKSIVEQLAQQHYRDLYDSVRKAEEQEQEGRG